MYLFNHIRILVSFIVVNILFVYSPVFSQIIIIQPSHNEGKDVMIDTTYTINPNLWYVPQGNAPIDAFGINECAPDGFNVVCRRKFLIDFNLLPITDTGFISAKIVLFPYSIDVNPFLHSSNFSISNIISTWDENVVTWLNRPKFDTTGQVFFTINDSSVYDSIVVNITTLVKRKISSPDSIFGFSVSFLGWDTIGSVSVYASEYSDSSKRPKLVIAYPDTVSGISEITDRDILLYPNPIIDKLFIACQKNISNIDITITNAIGQTVYRKEETNLAPNLTKILDLSPFLNGIYFLTVQSNIETTTQKIIKQ